MTLETITQKIRTKNMVFGLGVGLVVGFFIRDEFYFPTYQKVDDIVGSFKIK